MSSLKKIWVMYCSRKGGHTYPVQSLCDHIREHSEYSASAINLLDLSSLFSMVDGLGRYGDLKLKSIYRRGYQNLQRENPQMIGAYRFGERILWHSGHLKKKLYYRFGQPAIIISIQPEVNVLAHLIKDWFGVPFHTVIIDLAVHGLWVNRSIDCYYVLNDHIKNELSGYRVSKEKIIVSGMPLRKGFSQIKKYDKRKLRKKLGLLPDQSTILVVAGLLGTMIDFNAVIKSIMQTRLPIQVLAVFGKNENGRKKAASMEHERPLHLFGTVSNIEEMIWASDIVVSKPGSLSIAEALSLGKPMIVITPRAGSAQESRFASFLVENQAGTWVHKVDEVSPALSRILNSKDLHKQMCTNATKLGRRGLNATETIFRYIRNTINRRRK